MHDGTSKVRPQFSIFGGHTVLGQAVCARAAELGMKPTVVGEDPTKVPEAAGLHHFPWRVFSPTSPPELDRGLADTSVLLNCSELSGEPSHALLAGVVRNGIHYLDMSADLDLWRVASSLHERGRRHGVSIIPGLTLDMLALDAVLIGIAGTLPDATDIEIAMRLGTDFKAGAAAPWMKWAWSPLWVSRAGQFESVKPGSRSRTVLFDGQFECQVMAVSSAGLGRVQSVFEHGNATFYLDMGHGRSRWRGWVKRLQRVGRHVPVIRRFQRDTGEALRGVGVDYHSVWGEGRGADGAAIVRELRIPVALEHSVAYALDWVTKAMRGQTSPGLIRPIAEGGLAWLLQVPGVRWVEGPSGETR